MNETPDTPTPQTPRDRTVAGPSRAGSESGVVDSKPKPSAQMAVKAAMFFMHATPWIIVVGGFWFPATAAWCRVHSVAFIIPMVAVALAVYCGPRTIFEAWQANTVDDGLTARAENLSRHYNLRVGVVRINDTQLGRAHVYYTRRGSDLIVSQKTREAMSADEMDFILASLCSLQGRSASAAWFGWLPIILPLSAWPLYMAWSLVSPAAFSPAFMLAFMIGPVLWLMFWFCWKGRGSGQRAVERWIDADKRAVSVTKNTAAAVSALTKQVNDPMYAAISQGGQHSANGPYACLQTRIDNLQAVDHSASRRA